MNAPEFQFVYPRRNAMHGILEYSTHARHAACTVMFLLVFLAKALRNCLFASSNNCAEFAKSSAGNCDRPGHENTSCKAATRVDVVGGVCALPSSLEGLPLRGPITYCEVECQYSIIHIKEGKLLA